MFLLKYIHQQKNLRSHDDPSPSAVGEHLQTIIPRSVYDYAAMVHETFESPRQTKLDHDVNAVLGSNDPPPGFGFLHPRFYYLEQKRPVPMDPLRVSIFKILISIEILLIYSVNR